MHSMQVDDTNVVVAASSPSQIMLWGIVAIRMLGVVAFFIALAYATGALVFWHTPSAWLRGMLIVFMLVDVYLLWPSQPPGWVSGLIPELWMRRALAVGWVVAVIGLHATRKPRKGNWIKAQEKDATVEFNGDQVTIENYRFSKRSQVEGEKAVYQVDWQQRILNVSDIVGVDLVIQRFGAWKGSAHAMCSFRLKNGSNIVVSVESRRELSKFNPAGGLYHYYHLIILFGDERDLLWSRIASEDPYPMVVYPLDVTEKQAQDYFLNLAGRANQLAKQPEFYHLLKKNCLTVLVNASPHLSENLATDFRFCFPGFSQEYFSEVGLIKGDLEEVMQRYAVSKDTARPDYEGDGKAWSDSIRPERVK